MYGARPWVLYYRNVEQSALRIAFHTICHTVRANFTKGLLQMYGFIKDASTPDRLVEILNKDKTLVPIGGPFKSEETNKWCILVKVMTLRNA